MKRVLVLLWLMGAILGLAIRDSYVLRADVERLKTQEHELEATAATMEVAALGSGLDAAALVERFPGMISQQGLEVLFFRADCPGCDKAAPHWNARMRELARSGVSMVGIATKEDGLAEFRARHALEFPIEVDDDKSLVKSLGILETPSFVRVTANGRVVAQGAVADTIWSKRTDFTLSQADWPSGLQETLRLEVGREFFPTAIAANTIEVGEPPMAVVVYEDAGGILGFGTQLTANIPNRIVSDLDAWLVLKASGAVEAVLPLREHREGKRVIRREDLEKWASETALIPNERLGLARLVLKRVRSVRVNLGFSAHGAGVR